MRSAFYELWRAQKSADNWAVHNETIRERTSSDGRGYNLVYAVGVSRGDARKRHKMPYLMGENPHTRGKRTKGIHEAFRTQHRKLSQPAS